MQVVLGKATAILSARDASETGSELVG
jgi:hypothetical protein